MSTSRVLPLAILPEHIDQYGHVNYKAILNILEPFQDDFLSHVGISFGHIEEEHGLRSVVKKVEIVWHGQIKHGDSCFVATDLELGNTSMIFHQTIDANGLTVVQFTMVVVLVDEDFLKTPIPDRLRQLFS